MGRKQGYFGSRCTLLMVSSALLIPLKDCTAFQHAAFGRRCACHPQHREQQQRRKQQQQQQHRRTATVQTPWTPLSKDVPLFPGLPLKGSERDHDVTGGDDEAGTEDDSSCSSSRAVENYAIPAAPDQAASDTTVQPLLGEGSAAVSVGNRGGQDDKGAASSAAAATVACNIEEEVASFEFAPPMTVRKFKTMQDRRVPVLIKYSGGGGFKRYFEEIAKVLKRHFPDVIIDREIVEVNSTREEEVFEIRIDGKLVCAKRRGKLGVFLHMETFVQAIRKARQRRRPGSIVYGDQETYMNVKALTDQRTDDDLSLEREFKDFGGAPNDPRSL